MNFCGLPRRRTNCLMDFRFNRKVGYGLLLIQNPKHQFVCGCLQTRDRNISSAMYFRLHAEPSTVLWTSEGSRKRIHMLLSTPADLQSEALQITRTNTYFAKDVCRFTTTITNLSMDFCGLARRSTNCTIDLLIQNRKTNCRGPLQIRDHKQMFCYMLPQVHIHNRPLWYRIVNVDIHQIHFELRTPADSQSETAIVLWIRNTDFAMGVCIFTITNANLVMDFCGPARRSTNYAMDICRFTIAKMCYGFLLIQHRKHTFCCGRLQIRDHEFRCWFTNTTTNLGCTSTNTQPQT
jgi:hypothetical protein